MPAPLVGEEQATDNRNARAAQPRRGDARAAHLGLLAVAAALAAITLCLGRQPDLKTHVPECIGLNLGAGALYPVGIYLVEQFRLGRARLFTALDLGSAGLLLLLLATVKQPLHRVLVYAWNPTVLVSFALCGHHDSLAILTLLAAELLILARRRLTAMVFLALSFLAKFFPLVLLPIF